MKKLIFLLFAAMMFLLALSLVDADVYIVSGWIINDSIELEPFYYLGNYSETNQSNETEYFMEFYNASNYLLKSYNFSVFDDNITKIFFFEIDMPANTKRILFKNNSEYIKEINISENVPEIFNISINCSEISCEAIWDANDTNDENLTFDIYYANDDVNWSIMSLDWELNYISFSTESVSEGSYKLKIRASDGFNFVESESGYFNISEKAPSAFILSPINGSVFYNGIELYINGFGVDPEDGWLTENSSLTWKLNNEIIGYEEVLFLLNLSIGDYELRLEVNDAHNNKANDSVYFSIDNKTESDVSVNNIEFYPETSTQLDNGTIESIFLSIDLFNIRRYSYCNISLYDNNELFENDTILLFANDYTNYETWWQPNSTGNHTIKVSVTGCEPEENNTENNEMTVYYFINPLVNDTHKFYIKNSSGDNVAWLGNNGNIVLKGKCFSGGNCDNPGEDSFIIRNSTNNNVAFINSTGDLCVEKGDCYDESTSCNPLRDAFIIQNSSASNMSYIDFDGDLCLIGKLYQNSNP